MRKRGSLTNEYIPHYVPKTIRSAPVTPCDSEASTWSERVRSKTSYGFPTGYASTSYGDYDDSSYESNFNKSDYDTPSCSKASYEGPSGYNKTNYESSYEKSGYDSYEKSGYGEYRTSYEGSTGYEKGNEDYKHSYESEGMWWWRRPLGVRRPSCRQCGASSATRPLRMTPCAGVAQALPPPPMPPLEPHSPHTSDRHRLKSRDRPLLFVKQLFL
ncbi:unnamed protein product [Arctia plantaginis]|uniref:Uncharacterized protein n=1 Tax=Arctia plantaginis TaxID=874455 RepID=A0A8S1AE84_ARCPL|nr:unnamed protein product [Arctia plantaginis]CAB3243388.1 unnamed protein product [Arctia plantaginis]